MKDDFTNNFNIRGYLFDYKLRYLIPKPGQNKLKVETISGQLHITKGDDIATTVTLDYFAPKTFKSGNDNSMYTALKKIMEDDITYAKDGEAAPRLRVSGEINSNDFYGKDEQLHSTVGVRGGFIHELTPGEHFGENPATFENDIYIEKVFEDEDDENVALRVNGYVFGFKGRISPVKFVISNENTASAFQGFELPYFGKVQGVVKSNIVEFGRKEDADANVGFGEAVVVAPTTKNVISYDIVGGTGNLGLSDDTITTEDLDQCMKDRAEHLDAVKARAVAYRSKQTQGFPAGKTAPAKKAAAAPGSAGYKF